MERKVPTARACPSLSERGVQYSERSKEMFKACSSFSLCHGDIWTGMNFPEIYWSLSEEYTLLEVPNLAMKS